MVASNETVESPHENYHNDIYIYVINVFKIDTSTSKCRNFVKKSISRPPGDEQF